MKERPIERVQPQERYQPAPEEGLNRDQVAARQRAHLVNDGCTVPTKSVARILRDNICTLFNLVIAVLGAAVLAVGSHKNLLFVGVMLCNVLIGIVQELRTKRTIDKLSILSAAKVRCVREGAVLELDPGELVLDDVVELARGNQVMVDCVVLSGGCEVNESLITGEADAVHKQPGDMLLSGSFLVNGNCRARAEHIGADCYANSITNSARKHKKVHSEIMTALQRIVRTVSVAIIPVGALLFLSQNTVDGHNFQGAVVSTTAALVGMIPEGLVLLTTSVLAVSVIRLSRYRVMVQELHCIETLARVDVLCLDKTGTITQGDMELGEVLPLGDAGSGEIAAALNAFCAALGQDGPTVQAIARRYAAGTDWACERIVPFSSERKWSGAAFRGQGALVLGAPEMLLNPVPPALRARIEALARENRVLLLARSAAHFPARDELPPGLQPLALALVRDVIRPDAPDTLRYFREQGVALKVISGDSPITVSAIAQRVGLDGAEQYVDASALEEADIPAAVRRYTVFGRVSPDQKRLMVRALKAQGHTVAMTGDGVNDVLALREADCSVAMASGSEAARNVSQLVLLQSNFAAMPRVVAEGRRSINNLQRSAAIFIVKTIYSICLSLIFLLLHRAYPLLPIQLSLIGVLTIGYPSFVLALEPNHDRVQGSFMRNIIRRAAPGGLTVVISVVAITLLAPGLGLTSLQTSTLCVIAMATAGVMFIWKLSYPFNWLRGALFASVCLGLAGCYLFLRELFSLATLVGPMAWYALVAFVGAIILFWSLCAGVAWLGGRLSSAKP